MSWFWIPRWNIAPGRTSRQHVLAFPASNLVVESASPEHPRGRVGLAGPTTVRSHRDLSGQGWAVDVAPAWTLFAIVILGAFFGGMGIALAAPLVAVGRIAVLRFYVEDWLGDRPKASAADGK